MFLNKVHTLGRSIIKQIENIGEHNFLKNSGVEIVETDHGYDYYQYTEDGDKILSTTSKHAVDVYLKIRIHKLMKEVQNAY